MRSTLCSTRRARRFLTLLVVLVVMAAVVAAAHSPNATATTLKKFTTPGAHTWTVPTGVTSVTFDVFGARGGSVLQNNHGQVQLVSGGGAGGEAKGRFTVHAGEKFEIVVGGQGGSATVGSTTGTGGINGGGAGSSLWGGGGGGASDVRIGGRGNVCVTSNFCGYPARIIVGGGGGGGSSSGTYGAAGGGVTGNSAFDISSGGEQNFGGFCGSATPEGMFGDGGPGSGSTNQQSGGGGGGWYGGCGGGGGSGYVSALSLSGSFPGGTSQGDGMVIITTS